VTHGEGPPIKVRGKLEVNDLDSQATIGFGEIEANQNRRAQATTFSSIQVVSRKTLYLTIRKVLAILFDMGKKRQKVSDQIRAAIDAAGVTRYRISKDTGISESMLSRFMSGSRGLSMEALDTLGEYLDLEVVRRETRKGR
jgi:hypothetical protein